MQLSRPGRFSVSHPTQGAEPRVREMLAGCLSRDTKSLPGGRDTAVFPVVQDESLDLVRSELARPLR